MSGRDLPAVLRLLEQIKPALEPLNRATLKDIVGQLVALRAPLGSQWPSLAQLVDSIGEVCLSRKAIDLFVEQSGGTDAARYQKAGFMAHTGDWRAADTLLRALPEAVPDPVANAYSRGVVALNLGRRDEARRHFERVTAARPHAGSAWLGLAMATDLAHEPAIVERLATAGRSMEQAAPAERAAYDYALGTVLAARGEHAPAFAAVARGAQTMKASVGFDRDADRRQAAEALDGYDATRIADLARRQTEPTGRTAFVTGLPRSGTTLVEQVLTAHSAVDAGAEIAALALLAGEIGGAGCPAVQRFVEAEGGASAARLWHRWLDERFRAAGRVVDKSVDTSRYLGLVATLLPEAPLVWITRDPLDRAWSCFRTNFLGGTLPWSYDLEDIAAHFRLEDMLLAQWQQILGERLLVVSYEALVDEPQAWIRRILVHCGLTEEPQVFAPHANGRPVATASMVQVRRPIGRESVGSAEPYRQFLEPFITAYHG